MKIKKKNIFFFFGGGRGSRVGGGGGQGGCDRRIEVLGKIHQKTQKKNWGGGGGIGSGGGGVGLVGGVRVDVNEELKVLKFL